MDAPRGTVLSGGHAGAGLPAPGSRACSFSRADTIYGGSNQIQRNVLGEQVLGCREPP
jgi:acyl-CoA dehydrogenase